jgi:tetratricopeptide (TPR) repeat protein
MSAARVSRNVRRTLIPLCLAALALQGSPWASTADAAPGKGGATDKPAAAPAPPKRAATYDFQPIDDAIAAGDWQGAASSAEAVLADPTLATAHAGAWARVGAAMQSGNLPYAALASYLEGVRVQPAAVAPYYTDILKLGEQLREVTWVGQIAGADFSVPVDAVTRSELAMAAARYQFSDASWATTSSLLGLVDKDGPQALDALILQGISLAQQSRYEAALEPLLAAREQLATRAGTPPRDAHFRNTLDLNIARTYYGAGNYGRAMEFFAKVEREDASWPEANFERAWAHFMVNDMNGVLSLLMTHSSPFFDGWYFPEAELLRAQALFLMCKFPDASAAIDEFQAGYRPILDATRAASSGMSPAEAWDDGRRAVAGEATALPRSLLSRFTRDERFKTSISAIALADDDLAKLDRLSDQPFAARVRAALVARRDARVAEEGARVLDWAREAATELDGMLTDIELARIDLLSFQADQLEKAAAMGKPPPPPPVPRKLRKDVKKKAGKQIWPFEGEYWADELGYFRVDTRPECPKELQRVIGQPEGAP